MTLRDEVLATLGLCDGLSLALLADGTKSSMKDVSAILEGLALDVSMAVENGVGVKVYRLQEDDKEDVLAAKDIIKEYLEKRPGQRFDTAEIVAHTGVPDGTARGVLRVGGLQGHWQSHEPGEGRRVVTYSANQRAEIRHTNDHIPKSPVLTESDVLALGVDDDDDGRLGGFSIHPSQADGAQASEPVTVGLPGAEYPGYTPQTVEWSPPWLNGTPSGRVDTKRRPKPSALDELCEVQREIGRLQARAEALKARLAG